MCVCVVLCHFQNALFGWLVLMSWDLPLLCQMYSHSLLCRTIICPKTETNHLPDALTSTDAFIHALFTHMCDMFECESRHAAWKRNVLMLLHLAHTISPSLYVAFVIKRGEEICTHFRCVSVSLYRNNFNWCCAWCSGH